MAQGFGVGRMTVQRFIRLTELIPPILQMVDEGKIALTPAVELSFLEERRAGKPIRHNGERGSNALTLTGTADEKPSQSGRLDMDMIFSIMTEEKGNQKETLKINTSKLKNISRRTQRRSRWRTPSSNFWSVNCRGNGAGTAANLSLSDSKYRALKVEVEMKEIQYEIVKKSPYCRRATAATQRKST